MKKTLSMWTLGGGLLILVAGIVIQTRSPAEEGSLPQRPFPDPRAGAERGNLADPLSATLKDRASAPRTGLAGGDPNAAPGASRDPSARRALRHAEEDYWEDLGSLLEVRSKEDPLTYQRKVAALTAAYLGFDPFQAELFDRAAQGTTHAIGRAWKERNEAMLALPEDLSPGERAEQERQIQEDYEVAKSRASEGVESLLLDTPRHQHFREKLGEWIDAVR